MQAEYIKIFLELKKKSGLSNQQIADKTNLSISTINRFFRGEMENPDLEKVTLILGAMGYSLSDLADDEKISISRYNVDELLLPYIERIAEPYLHQIEILQSEKEHLLESLAYRKLICNILLAISVSLIAFICVILVIDLANPNIGWYRGAYTTFTQIFHKVI